MKQLKSTMYLLFVTFFMISCDKETNVIQENAEVNSQNAQIAFPNYPPTSFSKTDVFNFKTTVKSREEYIPCELINGDFETGDFTGWNIETNGEPYTPWRIQFKDSDYFGGEPRSEIQEPEASLVAANGFDGAGPMTFVMYQDVLVCSCAEFSWEDRVSYNHGGEPRTLEVQLRNPSNNSLIETLYTFTSEPEDEWPYKDTGWQSHVVDISSYAGSMVRIYFLETIPENFTGPAQIEFDNLELNSYDADNDGFCDSIDAHPNSNTTEEFNIMGCYPGIDNVFVGNGSTMMDQLESLIAELNEQYTGDNYRTLHKKFTTELSKITYYWYKNRLISSRERSKISSCAWGANIPYYNEH